MKDTARPSPSTATNDVVSLSHTENAPTASTLRELVLGHPDFAGAERSPAPSFSELHQRKRSSKEIVAAARHPG